MKKIMIFALALFLTYNISFAKALAESNKSNKQNIALQSRASDKVLWNESYSNVRNIKKDIFVRNYQANYETGTVYVTLTNTGNVDIQVNMYKSAWNSETIVSGSVAAGTSETFVVPSSAGASDCHRNNCFGEHNFTVSVFSLEGRALFTAMAKVVY